MVTALSLCTALVLVPGAAGADEDATDPGVGGFAFTTASGEVADTGGTDQVTFDLDPADFTMSSGASLSLTFVVSATEGSELGTGQVDVVGVDGTPDPGIETRRQEIAGAQASVAVYELAAGSYEVVVNARQHTAGAYELEISLTGDANGDYLVDEADLARIGTLTGNRWNHDGYLAAADTDRNGVINKGDVLRASRNLGAATTRRPDGSEPGDPGDVQNPLDETLDYDALRLVGLSTNGLNPVSAPIRFELEGAEFWQDLDEVELTVNGLPVSPTVITLEPHALTATNSLWNGRNDIRLAAYDDVGRNLYYETTVWAGAYSVRVDLYDEDGAPVTEPSTVWLQLADDQDVSVAATTSSGSAFFQNLPFTTIVVEAVSEGGLHGGNGLLGGQQSVVAVQMVGLGEPSEIDNNDFSLGTDGWEIGNSPAWIVPYIEGYPPGLYPPPGGFAAGQGSRAGEPPMAPAPDPQGDDPGAQQSGNSLVVMTSGQGEQGVSRTFTTQPGTTRVTMRYRFITSEVPGGWFGSEFNDYFRVLLTAGVDDTIGESNSMNGLGLGAFDFASGATAWREVTIEVDPEGETIRIDAAVANVADGFLDSQVVLAWVEEGRDQVRPALAWHTTAGGMDLTYEVVDGELENETTIEVFAASGTISGARLGSALMTHTVPEGTPEGSYGPEHIAGSLLVGPPTGTTHFIAVASSTSVGSLRDVEVRYTTHADPAVVWQETEDLLMDGMRYAGQASGWVTRTTADAVSQARAMFDNIVMDCEIEQNLPEEYSKYGGTGTPGSQVIDVFVAETEGLTCEEILDDAEDVKQAMSEEIERLGCRNVSKHCGDPDTRNVVDFATNAAPTTAEGAQLFMDYVDPRADHFIDERNRDHFHIELVR